VALFARPEMHTRPSPNDRERHQSERIGYLEPVDERELTNRRMAAGEGSPLGTASGRSHRGTLAAAAVALIPGVGPALVGGALLSVVLVRRRSCTGAVAGGLLGADSAEGSPTSCRRCNRVDPRLRRG